MALSTNCWKYLVLAYNVFFAMSAVALFVLSGILLYRLFIYRHFIGTNVEYPAIVLVMMGIIACSIAWIGWRTASSMHRIHIIMAGILLVVVVLVEFGCFVWAMVVWETLDIDVKLNIGEFFALAVDKDLNSPEVIRWDRMQVQMKCCGVGGPTDYRAAMRMPYSCCGQGPLDALQAPHAGDCAALYQRGCASPLYEYAKHQVYLVAMTALGASIIQSSGIFCTFLLASAIGDRRRASIRNSLAARDATLPDADDTLLASAPPKF